MIASVFRLLLKTKFTLLLARGSELPCRYLLTMRLAYAINKMKPDAANLNASLWLEDLAKCILSKRPVEKVSFSCTNYVHQQCRFLYRVVVYV